MREGKDTPFECVDPQVGDQIHLLDDPSLASPLRSELEAHLDVCHACSLLVRVDAKASQLLRAGHALPLAGAAPGPVTPSKTAARYTPAFRMRVIAGVAFAACLFLTLTTPPRSISPNAVSRGSESVHFVRPVEGEVLAAREPILEWTSIEGASRYLVEVRNDEGVAVWNGESTETELRVPSSVGLERGRAYRAILSVQPMDLVPPGSISVLFRADSIWKQLLHRVRWADPLLQIVTLLALIAFIASTLPVRRFAQKHS